MAKPTAGTEVDAALDELYGASPAEFTARRDALAKRLKDAGDGAAAAEIKGRRKPTQLAYVLNQLARRHADDVAELVDVGRELARTQRKALRGEAGHDLRDAIARQRSVAAAVTSKAAKLMGELGVAVSGHLDEIASALRTAMVDPGVGAQLEEGRLEKVPEVAAGFPGTTTLQLVRSEPEHAKADASAKAKAKAKADADADARAHAKADADAARGKEHTRAQAKARALAERKERERAKRRAEATAAGAEAAERARIADEAEREADGHAAEAKKLDDEADALAAEAKRMEADAKHLAAEAKARAAEAKARAAEAKAKAHEADAARRKADRAATEAAGADKHAKLTRTEADRAVKHARTVEARAGN